MKKLTALLLALMLCVSALTACGENGAADVEKSAPGGEAAIEETTVLDEQGFVAVAKSLGKFDSEWMICDYALAIDVTNNSDKTVSIGIRNFSVNGCMFDDSVGIRVEPGKTETLPADIDTTTLKNYGIGTIADLEFKVVVEDDDTYVTLLESEPVTIKTSAYEGFEYTYDESGTILYDADGVKIIAKDELIDDDFFGEYVNLYVINQTDKYIDVSVEEGSANGKAANIGVGSYTPAGKRSINILSIEEEDRPEKLESLTLSFSISDEDNGDVIVEKTDPVTLTF